MAANTSTIRASLQTAKKVSPPERDAYIKVALGETVWLCAAEVSHATDLREQLVNVLVTPDEEAPYFINRALSLLEKIEDKNDDTDDREEDPATAQENR